MENVVEAVGTVAEVCERTGDAVETALKVVDNAADVGEVVEHVSPLAKIGKIGLCIAGGTLVIYGLCKGANWVYGKVFHPLEDAASAKIADVKAVHEAKKALKRTGKHSDTTAAEGTVE